MISAGDACWSLDTTARRETRARRSRIQRLVGFLVGAASSVALFASAEGCAATSSPSPIVDVHVTQAIQSAAGNDLWLVARRPIVVRVLVSGRLKGHSVTGDLSLFSGRTPIATGIAPMNAPLVVPDSPGLDRFDGTLNFRVADATLVASGTLTFKVRLIDEESRERLDTWTDSFEVAEPLPLRIHWVEILLPESRCRTAAPCPPSIAPGIADAFLRSVVPVDDLRSSCDWCDPPQFAFTIDSNGDGKLDRGGDDTRRLLDELQSMLFLFRDPSRPPGEIAQIYGWVPESSANDPCRRLSFYGWANGTGAAVGTTLPESFQATFAHEVGHGLGEMHGRDRKPPESDPAPRIGFDPGDRLYHKPKSNGVDQSRRWSKSRLMHLFMNPGAKTNDSWIGARCLERLLHLADRVNAMQPRAAARSFTLVIRGHWSGNPLVEPLNVSSIVTYPWPIESVPMQPEAGDSQFSVRVKYKVARRSNAKAGDLAAIEPSVPGGEPVEVRAGVEPIAIDDSDSEAPRLAAVEEPITQWTSFDGRVEVPSVAVIELIEILRTNGSTKEVLYRVASAPGNPLPEIDHLSVSAHPSTPHAYDVRWSVVGVPDPSKVVCHVAWSRDGGTSFMPLRVSLTSATSDFAFTFTPAPVGTAGKRDGLIRVIASDGLNSDFADSDLFELR